MSREPAWTLGAALALRSTAQTASAGRMFRGRRRAGAPRVLPPVFRPDRAQPRVRPNSLHLDAGRTRVAATALREVLAGTPWIVRTAIASGADNWTHDERHEAWRSVTPPG